MIKINRALWFWCSSKIFMYGCIYKEFKRCELIYLCIFTYSGFIIIDMLLEMKLSFFFFYKHNFNFEVCD